MNKSSSPSSNSQDSDSPNSSPPNEPEEDIDMVLVKASQEGDLNAFTELIKRYQDTVYALLYNLAQKTEVADDLTQQTLIKAWKGISQFERKSKFQTWLYRIAHNVFYDYKKKFEPIMEDIESPTFKESSIDSFHSISSQELAPSQLLELKEKKQLLKRALHQLSDEQRNVIILKDVHDLSYKEIADITQSSVGTVMSRLHYGRQNLRNILFRYEQA